MTDQKTSPDPTPDTYRAQIAVQLRRWAPLQARCVAVRGADFALDVNAAVEGMQRGVDLDDATHARDLADLLKKTFNDLEAALEPPETLKSVSVNPYQKRGPNAWMSVRAQTDTLLERAKANAATNKGKGLGPARGALMPGRLPAGGYAVPVAPYEPELAPYEPELALKGAWAPHPLYAKVPAELGRVSAVWGGLETQSAEVSYPNVALRVCVTWKKRPSEPVVDAFKNGRAYAALWLGAGFGTFTLHVGPARLDTIQLLACEVTELVKAKTSLPGLRVTVPTALPPDATDEDRAQLAEALSAASTYDHHEDKRSLAEIERADLDRGLRAALDPKGAPKVAPWSDAPSEGAQALVARLASVLHEASGDEAAIIQKATALMQRAALAAKGQAEMCGCDGAVDFGCENCWSVEELRARYRKAMEELLPLRAANCGHTIIAIDGPAGAGKSTVARDVAAHLGFTYVDTGAIYRVLALMLIEYKVTDLDGILAHALLLQSTCRFAGSEVWVGSRDVSEAIRTDVVAQRASEVSTIPEVRGALLALQRHLAEDASRGAVLEGRDIGTVVFPQAHVKIFLTASLEARAGRRYESTLGSLTMTEARTSTHERDQRDMLRAVAPLRQAEDAVHLDNTDLTPGQTLKRVLCIIETLTSR